MRKAEKNERMSEISRQRFFDTTVHIQAVKDCLSGKNEDEVIKVLVSMGYVLGKDFVRQYPFGERYVLDFAFINEQVGLEIDGDGHRKKEQRRSDKIRDSFLRSNNWVVIRILDREFKNTYKFSFYKNLIREVVEERRQQWEVGEVRKMDITKFYESDYEYN